MKKLWIVSSVLILLCLPLEAFSQQKLRGRVLKAGDSTAVIAANVFLKKHPTVGTATDISGNFEIVIPDSLLSGSLVITAIGYEKKVVPLSSLSREKVNVIQLRPDIASLSKLVVTADYSLAAEFATEKLDRIDIYMSPVSSGDPLKAITLLPSSTNTSETANPTLRGSPGSYSRVVLNGVPIYNPVRFAGLSGLGTFSILDTELIESVIIYPGNPPLTYGNSIAGLVEINTRDYLEETQFKIAASLAGGGLLYSAPLSGDSTFVQLFGNVQFSDAYLAINAGNTPGLKGFSSQDVGVNFHYTISNHWSANDYAYFMNDCYSAVSTQFNYTSEINAGKTRFFNIFNLKYQKSNWLITFNNEINVSSSNYTFGNLLANKNVFQSYNAIDVKYFPAENFSVQMGIADNYFNVKLNGVRPYRYYAVFPADSSLAFESRIEHHNIEGYVYGRYRSDKIVLGVGLRKNIPTAGQISYLSYQASLRYNLSSQSSVIASAGKYSGYSILNFYTQRFEQISSTQFAIEYNYKSANTELNLALYTKKEDAPFYFYEIGTNFESKRNILGAEVFLRHQVNRFKATVSYTWLNSHINFVDRRYRSYNDMNYILKLALSYTNINLLNASVSFITRPGLYYTPIIGAQKVEGISAGYKPIYGGLNAGQLDNYSRINISLNKLIAWNDVLIVPFLTVSNILNTINEQNPIYSNDYETIVGYEHYKERTVYFGVQVSF